jgi:hypothetical protein
LIAQFIFAIPANAEALPESLVIVDTALNSGKAEFSKNIIYEVCILEWATCPNETKSMEGKGSANIAPQFIDSNGFDHGTLMVSAAVRTNPNLKIIFIRIVANSNTGERLNVSPTTVALALKWVLDNQTRFNIKAVAMSQGHHNLTSLTRYCPNENSTEYMVKQLRTNGILLFVPAGNSRDYERLDWPACIPDVISIGALNPDGKIASYSNLDNNLIDYFENGTLIVNNVAGYERTAEGSSVSVQVAAAKWMQFISYYPNLSTEDRLQEFDRFTHPVTNNKITNGKALPEKIENPEVRIYLETEYHDELAELRVQLQELSDLIKLLIAAIQTHK